MAAVHEHQRRTRQMLARRATIKPEAAMWPPSGMHKAHTRAAYVLHAKRYGLEGMLRAYCEEHGTHDLAEFITFLADLRALDRKFKLPPGAARVLALRMHREGYAPSAISVVTNVSPAMLRNALKSGGGGPESASTSAVADTP